MQLVVTGASGYIGSRFTAIALKKGHEVVIATRRRTQVPGTQWMPFDLSSKTTIVLPTGTQAIIHLAADTSSIGDTDDESEVLAARNLVFASRQMKAKFVFVSSQTARPDAPTGYGRKKWRIEQDVLAAGGWVVRPGLVYGGSERALFGTIVDLIRRLPFLPSFIPAPQVQPVHVDDLSEGLLKIAESEGLLPGVIFIGSPMPVSFVRFLKTVAKMRLRRRRLFFPAPIFLIKIAARLMGESIPKRWRVERLFSLFDLPRMYPEEDLNRFQLSLRTLTSGMHRSGDDRRRRLLREGKALLIYILKGRPRGALLRRYVRAIEKLRDGSPLDLPAWIERLPVTLALLDDNLFASSKFQAEVAWRIDSATMIAEASVQGAYRFLWLGRTSNPIMHVMHILHTLVLESTWRLIQVISVPLLRRVIRQKWGHL